MQIIYIIATLLALTQQVLGESNSLEKRHVSVLARLGELPYAPGKRYIAAMAKNGELTSYLRPAWNKKYQDSMEEMDDEEDMEKRYVGSLARAGDLRLRSSEEKRNGVEGLVRGLATGEELKRLRLEALKEELYRERQEEAQSYLDPDDKREYTSEESDMDDVEDSIEKRDGGISSLLRNGYPFPKRTMDDELEQLMTDVYGIEDKRSVSSLARGLNFPMALNGKRDDKRNLQALMRGGAFPVGEGKRHIGSFVRAYGMPYSEKRNVVSLAKNRDFPYVYMPGKREDWSDESEESSELSKRYVAALLRQGRLPVGDDSHQLDSDDGKDSLLRQEDSKEDDHTERKKKSIQDNAQRSKRDTFSSDLYAFGAVQDKIPDDQSSPINKKYFGVRGGGKLPGSRLPSLGRRSGRNENTGRRRGHAN